MCVCVCVCVCVYLSLCVRVCAVVRVCPGCGEWGPDAGRGGGGSWRPNAAGDDPVAAEVMDQSPAMILDGGPDLDDPGAFCQTDGSICTVILTY